jgi:hypothetical protein
VPGEYTVILGGKLGDTPADAETHVEEVQPATMLEFPIVDSSQQSADLGMMNWLIYLSLLIALTGLILGVMALRNSRR